jgi:hypothetical protein
VEQKRKVSTKEVLEHIKSGLSDDELMQEYRLTAEELRSFLNRLIDAGLLKKSEIEARASLFEMMRDGTITTEQTIQEPPGTTERSDDIPQLGVEISSKPTGDNTTESSSTVLRTPGGKSLSEDDKKTIFFLIILTPLGLYRLWKTSEFKQKTKIILTVVTTIAGIIFIKNLLMLWTFVVALYAIYYLYQTTRINKPIKVAVGCIVLVLMVVVLNYTNQKQPISLTPEDNVQNAYEEMIALHNPDDGSHFISTPGLASLGSEKPFLFTGRLETLITDDIVLVNENVEEEGSPRFWAIKIDRAVSYKPREGERVAAVGKIKKVLAAESPERGNLSIILVDPVVMANSPNNLVKFTPAP